MHVRSQKDSGFTIVETMIVLAISALMFTLAISAMSGKQQQTEFQTGVNTLKSELNNQIANVADGYYQQQSNGLYVSCTSSLGPNNPVSVTATGSTPSTPDSSCVADGEIISFGPISGGQESFYAVPVFGCNYIYCNPNPDPTTPGTAGTLATSLTEALPIYNNSIYTATAMPFGLYLDSSSSGGHDIYYGSNVGAFGMFDFTSFGTNPTATSSTLSAGSQHVEVIPIYNTTPGNNPPTGLPDDNESGMSIGYGSEDMIKLSAAGDGSPGTSITVNFCVDSGTSDNKSALFTIAGYQDSSNSVTDQIFNGSGCTQ